jgi:tetratricopeptide (TPR) repeat protein
VLDALGVLVGKSMLGAEHQGGGTRYQLLETLRQYALEQLDARSETDALRRRHAVHYAAFAQHIGPLLLGAEELSWRPRLKLELDNLRAAVGWAIERTADDDSEFGLRIIASLAREAVLDRGSGIGGWAARAIVATSPSSPWRPTVMVSAVFDAFHRGDLDEADDLASEAFDAARDSDLAMAAWAQMARANIAASRGRLDDALAILDEVATWLPEASVYDRHTIHSIIALYTSLTGDSAKALASARIALEAARALGQPSALALALYANGMVLAEIDAHEARSYCEQSIELTDRGASDVVYANAFGTLALMSTREGDISGALRGVRMAITYAHSIGDRPPMVGTLHTAGRLLAPVADAERFATLAGGVLDGWFEPMSTIIPDRDRLPASALAAVEAALGTDRYRAARARGAAMTYDELVALVVTELDTALAALD